MICEFGTICVQDLVPGNAVSLSIYFKPTRAAIYNKTTALVSATKSRQFSPTYGMHWYDVGTVSPQVIT
uniref:Uncharacterized protein n=1 Tax=Trichuris muris TaxID=70415 RepID=A0A5S6QI92_TRIMR